MFDPPEMVPYASIPYEVNDSEAHRQVALAAARDSLVLLKNRDGVLPLRKDLESIAVIDRSRPANVGQAEGLPPGGWPQYSGRKDAPAPKGCCGRRT